MSVTALVTPQRARVLAIMGLKHLQGFMEWRTAWLMALSQELPPWQHSNYGSSTSKHIMTTNTRCES